MATLLLTETDTTLTYTGVGEAAGFSLVVTKNDAQLEVHQIAPVSMTSVTWQELRDSLAPQLED